MKSNLGILTAVALLAASAAGAQEPPGGATRPMAPGGGSRRADGPAGRPDALAEQFFPPDLIMRNSNKIGLTPDQESAIKSQMQQAQSQFIDLEWKLHHEQEAFQELVQKEKPDEALTLAQLDKLLKIENEVKKGQTTLMVRIKNVLTPQQQTQLRTMRRQMLHGENAPGGSAPGREDRREGPGRGGPGSGGTPPEPPGPPPGE